MAVTTTKRPAFQHCLIMALVLWTSATALAQVQIHPAPRISSDEAARTERVTARTKSTPPLQLPFWDDFSTTRGLMPDTTRWLHGKTVWVNESMAINAPTEKVATFDGLDSAGLAYNASEILLTGFTDSLVSRKIDMRPATVGDITSVYFSFFYQMKGNGEPPDAGEDFLQVEFLNSSGQWEVYLTVNAQQNFDPTVFYSSIVKVEGDRFFHENFQFRFRSFGRQSGPYDTWNIDYVYLNKGRAINDLSFPDRAAASAMTSLLGNYRAIPYSHFQTNPQIAVVEFDVQNLKNDINSVLFDVDGDFTSYTGGVSSVYSTKLLNDRGVRGTDPVMAPFARVRSRYDISLPDPSNPTQFPPTADSVDVTLTVSVISADENDPDKADFAPYDLRVNDTITATFPLRDYYAYDDGIAEYAVSLIGTGDSIAYEFNMLNLKPDNSLYPDTLIGFDVYFPPYAITGTQYANFFIATDDVSKPNTPSDVLLTVRREIVSAGINKFTHIRFEPALLINRNVFYIGWRKLANDKVFIGLDKDNDTNAKILVNTNTTQTWSRNSDIHGSLMIRPVFGKGDVGTTNSVGPGEETKDAVSLYPNPSAGEFFIDGRFDQLKIYSITGAEMSFESEKQGHLTRVRMQQPAGVYVVKYMRHNTSHIKKFVIVR